MIRNIQEKINYLRYCLMDWYEKKGRQFPWRLTDDTYKILIAEIMLRRTRAEQVLPIYNKFLEKYPDILSLSEADPEDIKKITHSLGLHWRNKKLKSLANEILSEYDGKIPLCRTELLSLPGVGNYVAGAFLCFALNEREWIVDTNIARVLQRFYGIELESSGRRNEAIIELSKKYVSQGDPKKAYYAILDFAALICKKRKPDHLECPVRSECEYYKQYLIEDMGLNIDEKEASLNNDFYVLDLFCGCGGFSLGFQQAGFKILLGVDNDEQVLETFENNLNTPALNMDLSNYSVIDEMIKKNNLYIADVIIAGPPCQGFSLTGPRNFDDERNTLYLAVLRVVEKIKPKAFCIENVPGLATLYNGEIRREIHRRIEKLGYNVTSDVLLAADYGVPQMRKRLFFVGLKKKLGVYRFPLRTRNEHNYISCSEAISDLPSREKELGGEEDNYDNFPSNEYQRIMRKKSSKLWNHVAANHTEKIKKVIAQVPDGGNYKDLPPGVGKHRNFNEAWTRYDSTKPSRTIDTGHRNHFHYKYNRVPTVRENARLQSFPDDFIFYGSKTQQYRQVGNAVPPLLARRLAIQLGDALRGVPSAKVETLYRYVKE